MKLTAFVLLSLFATILILPSSAALVDGSPVLSTCLLLDNDYCDISFEWTPLGRSLTIGVIGEFEGDYEYAITNEVRTAGFKCYDAAGPVVSYNGYSPTESCFWGGRTWPPGGMLRLFCYSHGVGELGCFVSS